MKLSTAPRDEPDVSLTALIDVVFLLLIFFMVSTTFERESALAIELPEASQAPAEKRDQGIDIRIDAAGHFALNGQPLVNPELETLTRALEQASGKWPSPGDAPAVTISADAKTPHEAVVRAMDAARRAGLARLEFATRFEDGRESLGSAGQ